MTIVNNLNAGFQVTIIPDWGSINGIISSFGDPYLQTTCWGEGAWTLEELEDVQKAVYLVYGGIAHLGGSYSKAVGPAKIVRMREEGVSTTTENIIEFKNTTRSAYRFYSLVHELGHVSRNHTGVTGTIRENSKHGVT